METCRGLAMTKVKPNKGGEANSAKSRRSRVEPCTAVAGVPDTCVGSRLTAEHQAQAAALRLAQVAPGVRGPCAPQEPTMRCWRALQEAPCVSLGGILCYYAEMACIAEHPSS